jgi:glucose/arabinose dehydrogenase
MEGGAVATAPILTAEGVDDMRRMATRILLIVLVASSTLPLTRSPAVGVSRIRAVSVARGLAAPVGFTFLPSGVLVYLERHTGRIRFRNLVTGADHTVFRVADVDGDGTGGALGIEAHPQWPDKRVLYVFATRNTPGGLRNQVLRVDLERRNARVILSSVADPSSDHHGGRILFGPDGKLYVVIGDNRQAANAQDLSANVRGKILRINPDGSTPAGNPFGKVWAYGIRNSIGFGFDPISGKLWQTDNGPECNDEVNLVRKAGNHAWGPNANCPNTNNSGPTPRILPKHTFAQPLGITGLVFCGNCGLGSGAEGDLFVGDFNGGQIRRFDLTGARNGIAAGPFSIIDFPSPVSVLSMERAPDGRIYFSTGQSIFRLVRRS